MTWHPRRQEDVTLGLRSNADMENAIDGVVETAIIRGTLGPSSPYFGWSLQKFRAECTLKLTNRKALVAEGNSKTHCAHGHPYTVMAGRRRCQTCDRAYKQKYAAKRRAVA